MSRASVTRTFPSVGILLVNWNGKEDTLECLSSLRQDRYPNKSVLVVDNGSTDGSVDAIRAAYPEVSVLETGGNLGFTGGNNAGLAFFVERGAEYVYLLNNDTVSEPDALSALVAAAQKEISPAFDPADTGDSLLFPASWLLVCGIIARYVSGDRDP